MNEDEKGLYLADLRFGKAGIEADADYIFKFYLRDANGNVTITQSNESREIEGSAFNAFIDRIWGV